MTRRLTLPRHNPYATVSNKTIRVKTPGGRTVMHHKKKLGSFQKCGECKAPLGGVARARPEKMKRLRRSKRTVSRAYGGTLSAQFVRERIVRAFLLEEQRCVKEMLLEKEKQNKLAEMKAATTKKPVTSKKSSKKA